MAIIKDISKCLDSVKELLWLDKSQDQLDRLGVLELALDELRIIYARLDASNDTQKIRILTFLGAGLALLSYLYGGGDLFIPHENYGKVFYFIGLGLVISSISMFLHNIRPSWWSVPLETKIPKILRNKTKIELLETIVEEYIESMGVNIVRYEKKVIYMHSAFFQLLCGGILLLVIKNIGG
jgi:hypothetical protein